VSTGVSQLTWRNNVLIMLVAEDGFSPINNSAFDSPYANKLVVVILLIVTNDLCI